MEMNTLTLPNPGAELSPVTLEAPQDVLPVVAGLGETTLGASAIGTEQEVSERQLSPALQRSLGRVTERMVQPIGDVGNNNGPVMAFNSAI
jgi:hypothetical protein